MMTLPPPAPTADPPPDWEGLMGLALHEARRAELAGEVPVGALVVAGGEVVGRGFNRPIGSSDPTAHAEMLAIREAATRLGNYRLAGADLVVTLEPCLMCFGAALHARLGRVVFGASDPRVGASSIILGMQAESGILNHRLGILGGVRADEAAALLRAFFEARRRPAGAVDL